MQHGTQTSVKSASRAMEIVEQIAQRGPMTAREISGWTKIPESSLFYLLFTLQERDWVFCGNDRIYSLGSALSRLAAGAPPPRAERIRKLVSVVGRETGETASLFVRRGDEIEVIFVEPSSHVLRFMPEKGLKIPLHSFAAGKALLANLESEALSSYMAGSNRERFTPFTLVEENRLRQDVQQAQTRGYSLAREEHMIGVIGMGVALDKDHSLSVALPTPRFNEDFEKLAAKALLNAVQSLQA